MISDSLLDQDFRQTFPFLDAADPSFAARFQAAASLVRLEPGQPVCHQGDRCGVLPLVMEGSARIYKTGDSGREITLYRLARGDSCVLTASCILSARPFPASAICETPVRALAVPAPQVIAWLSDTPAWREFLFGLVAERLHRIIGVVEDVVFLRLDQRLADYLLNQPARSDDGCLHLTHQRIADDLGTSREVISRLLKDLEQRQLLSIGRGRICINSPDGLRRLTDPR